MGCDYGTLRLCLIWRSVMLSFAIDELRVRIYEAMPLLCGMEGLVSLSSGAAGSFEI